MEPDPSPYSSSFIHGEKWLDFNSIQTWKSVELIYPFVTKDYNLKPVKPVLMAEGAYERGSEYGFDVTPLWVRRQAYYSYLAGTITPMGIMTVGDCCPPGGRRWTPRVRPRWGILRKVFEVRKEWWHLVPDQGILAAGSNTSGTLLHLAARHKDGEWLMVYLADAATFSIDRSKFTGEARPVRCRDRPADGRVRIPGEVPNRGVQQFVTPAGWEDALLILESPGRGHR